MRPTAKTVLLDAYFAWARGDDETRGFTDFASWAILRLAQFGYEVTP